MINFRAADSSRRSFRFANIALAPAHYSLVDAVGRSHHPAVPDEHAAAPVPDEAQSRMEHLQGRL